MSQLHTCNVYKPSGKRMLWQLTPGGNDFKPGRDFPLDADSALPKSVVNKGWGTLFNKKINIAWLPPGTAFLKVIQLPASETAELLSMVEFQLEKISPLPVAQVVWSAEILPQKHDGQQTVIVTIAARQQVETFLGKLEEQGYMSDRIEVSVLDYILTADVKGDGVWLYPPQDGTEAGWIIAWWYGGVLRHLGLIHMPDTDSRAAVLKSQLLQMAWTGELEGWLSDTCRWHLVADSVSAAMWESVIREVAGESVDMVTPQPMNRLSALTAKRACLGVGMPNLLPQDYVERYRARYVDGLWMSSITAVVMVYLLFAVAYFGFLEVLKVQVNMKESDVKAISQEYTNTIMAASQLKILQDQQSFKYAALECWDAVARYLPEGLTLQSLNLSKEKTLTLYGIMGPDQNQVVLEFNGKLKEAQFNGKPLFSKVNAPFMGNNGWNFTCELNRVDSE